MDIASLEPRRGGFEATTDPALIQFENSMSDGNRMYVMKVLGTDCSNQEVCMG